MYCPPPPVPFVPTHTLCLRARCKTPAWSSSSSALRLVYLAFVVSVCLSVCLSVCVSLTPPPPPLSIVSSKKPPEGGGESFYNGLFSSQEDGEFL